MPESKLNRARVLVIDDEDATRYILRRVLTHAGFDVDEAATGSDGLAKATFMPDIIIADVKLPDMLGYEVCRRLKANLLTTNIPILQISALFVSDESKVQGLEGGADSYLTHPVEPKVLVAQINALLRIRKAENLARLSALQWEITFNALSDGIALADGNGTLLRANSTFMRLLDLVYSEIEGRQLGQIFESRFGVTLGDFLALDRGDQTSELTSGRRWFRARYDTIDSGPEKSAGSVLIITDITEHKKLQETLKLTERLAATGRLAHIIAHEINNPLEALSNLLYLAGQDLAESPETASYIEQASAELIRISTITKQVLAYHRESVSPSLNPAGEILDAVLAIFRSHIMGSGVKLLSRVDCNDEIFVRAGEIRQVFSNLISNAVDAMNHERGTLRVRCIRSKDYVSGRVGVRFLFSDSGSGIPPEVMARVFEAFYTTKEAKGSGIGLWLSAEVVSKHHGSIRVRTRTEGLYKGTLFDIFIPIPVECNRQLAEEQVHVVG